jgi:chaperonin GroES
MNFEPLGDHVLILPLKEKQGIDYFVPSDHSLVQPMFGKIVAVGPGRFDEPMSCKVGDEVAFPQHGHRVITMKDGVDYLVMSDKAIFGRFK